MFKVGDKVVIKKDSNYFNLHPWTPGDTVGTIVKISDYKYMGEYRNAITWMGMDVDDENSGCQLPDKHIELAQSYLQQEEAKKLLGLK